MFEWEQKYKALASLEDLKKKVQRLKDEMAWALISEKEKVNHGLKVSLMYIISEIYTSHVI